MTTRGGRGGGRGRRGDRARRGIAAADLVATVLQRRGVSKEVREHRLLTRWSEVIGEENAARSFPDGLCRGVLWVRVESSAWMHQLSFLRRDLVERANRLLGDPPLVGEVRFHLGPRRPQEIPGDDLLARAARLRRRPARPRQLPEPASGARLAAIEREAATVEDEELRDIIFDARRRLNL